MKVAVVGATGAVGRELLAILEQRRFPVTELRAFASPRSEGKEIRLGAQASRCEVLKPGCFKGVQIAFFDASDAVSKEWVPQAAEAGAWVVDNSATFRLEDDVLLLVPEVNGEQLERKLQECNDEKLKKGGHSARGRILAGPNCSTVQMVVALKPILENWGLKRVVVSTYQSASGAGSAAMEELRTQLAGVLAGKPAVAKAFVHPIAFNCIPHIGGFKADGSTSEEQKMIAESRKLLSLPGLRISAMAVRVPTLSCHSESVNVECERAFEIADVLAALRAHPGIILEDDPSKNLYPMGLGATGRDAVYVGRIRRDPSVEHGMNLWVVSDNLRKGAALNAIQIGEMLIPHLQRA